MTVELTDNHLPNLIGDEVNGRLTCGGKPALSPIDTKPSDYSHPTR